MDETLRRVRRPCQPWSRWGPCRPRRPRRPRRRGHGHSGHGQDLHRSWHRSIGLRKWATTTVTAARSPAHRAAIDGASLLVFGHGSGFETPSRPTTKWQSITENETLRAPQKGPAMPKVDPDSGEMMTDDPELESDGERGGKTGADLPDGANPTGSDGPTQKGRSSEGDRLPSSGS